MPARPLLVLLLPLAACGSSPPGADSGAGDSTRAPGAVAALQEHRLPAAASEAESTLRAHPRSSQAAAVRALVRYHRAVVALRGELAAEMEHFKPGQDLTPAREALAAAERAFAGIEKDLAVASRDQSFSLELCLACWEEDWNGNRRIDEGDRRLFEVEYDLQRGDLPAGDPRRRPTVRFDVGDLHWARAMLAYQRAAIDLALAYRWSDLLAFFQADDVKVIRVGLIEGGRVPRAREQILFGLEQAELARTSYLAEKDDDREWVPNPRQKRYAAPLPVDQALYDTWAGINRDMRELVNGSEGLQIGELLRLRSVEGQTVPGFVDVGRMLREPADLVIDLDALGQLDNPATMGAAMRAFFGRYYSERMKPSPLPGRFLNAMRELSSQGEMLETKLRYLLWLN
ncbi:MAG TPA: hypothetical protein VNO33_20735 [Kofleriaceae bacterium]|nr:hypothetical protein [Kofleriaceae bacterium]